MRLAVVGGKLQGIEACYLAGKAGFDPVLIDRRVGAPAAGLAVENHVFDIRDDIDRTCRVLTSCDAVLPACEDQAALDWLGYYMPRWEVPLLFDLGAYLVTSSKVASNDLFEELDVPRPRPWPACGFPAVVKPSQASGSEGVRVVDGMSELEEARRALETGGYEVVVEEFVAGPSLSIEVMAWNGRAEPLLATGLEFDTAYDCKRVTAPVAAPPAVLESLADSVRRVAEALHLSGIMDLEVMVAGGEAKCIEIDARLPSQTPAAVRHAYDVNLVEMLVEAFLQGRVRPVSREPRRGAVYQHVRVADGRIAVVGEHVMGTARPLRLVEGFHGADEAMTDWHAGDREWVATLITHGRDVAEARDQADEAVRRIAARDGLAIVPETAPPGLERSRSW